MKRFLYIGACSTILLMVGGLFSHDLQAQHPQEHQKAAHAHHHQPSPLTAEQDSLVSAFVKRARKATKKYHDLNAAIAAGYRLVGPDFPGMGEHWVHAWHILQRDLRVEHPAILSYLRIDGKPVLTGVAYAQPVQRGEEPPDFILPGLWHYHSGSIDEETLILNPQSMHHESKDQPRLAMFHAWIWAENPSGLFVQDNWALPFLRLGIPVPEEVPPQAGKALFLLSDGVAYYAQLLEVAGEPNEADRAAAREVLERYYQHVQSRYQKIREVGTITEEDLEWLVTSWHGMWGALEEAVSPALWAKIKGLAG